MRRLLLVMLCMAVFCAGAIAQKLSVSGKVTDSTGSGIPGASVREKGTGNGTSANNSGDFSLSVNPGATLVISAAGFTEQEVAAANATSVVLQADQVNLSEVVVTALQTRRNKNEVVYANQVVKNEELNAVTNRSALNALQGKVAGVKIGAASGAVGASTRIVLRGETSLTGGNNALIVVDGVPINNSSVSGGGGTGKAGDRDNYVDFGNRANDINPDDIESMTVLKGPAATSLWGSRGTAGVILITTKKGKSRDGRPRISLNSSLSTDRVYMVYEEQKKFGSGYQTCNGCGGGIDIFMGENFAWGAPLDGRIIPWTGQPADDAGNLVPLSNGKFEQLSRPYSAVNDHINNFFDYGVTNRNNVSVDGGKENFTYFLSYTNYNNKGIVPHTKLEKNNILFNGTAKFSEKLSSTFNLNYTKSYQRGATEGGYPFGYSSGTPAYSFALQTPANIPFDEMRDYNSPYQDFKGFYAQYSINPYFILDQQKVENKVDNVIASVSLNYQIYKDLMFTGRASTNFTSSSVTEANPQFTYTRTLSWSDGELSDFNSPRDNGSLGSYKESLSKRNDLNFDLLLNYNKELGDFKVGATAGFNSAEQRSRGVFGSTVGGLVVPGFYDLSNSTERASSTNSTFHYRLFGAYLNANVGYKNTLFLEYSARNDWSSTLPSSNNSYFYQAGGLSFVPMNMFPEMKSDIFSYLKLRANVGTTGKDAPAYRLYNTYNINPTVLNYGDDYQIALPIFGQAGANLSNALGNGQLKPELTITYEAGIDIGLFRDRLNIEYTYYSSNSKDQIVDVNLPISSGFSFVPLNLGRMTNKGHELAVRATIIRNKMIDWKVFGTYSKNKNKVVSVADQYGLDELNIYTGLVHFSGHGSLNMVATEGLPFGTFKATDYVYDNQGNLVVDGTGNPKQSTDLHYIGSYQPKFLASFGTDFTIKGVTIHGLLDGRKGGLFYSGTKVSTEFNGTASTTVFNDRQLYVIPNSVVDDGTGSFKPNTVETAAYNFNKATPAAGYLLDASYLKLRELTLSYALPAKYLRSTPLSTVSLGLFAKNLFYWLPEENKFADPEVGGVGGNSDAQGIETTTTPSFRSFGVELKLQLK